jgi:hypothetical protein
MPPWPPPIGELADYRDTVLEGLLALRRDEA